MIQHKPKLQVLAQQQQRQAAVVIGPVVSQNSIQIHEPYRYTFPITGNPDTVEVLGVVKGGFYYDWDATTGMCEIIGNPSEFVGDIWTIVATKNGTEYEEQLNYRVIDKAPEIVDPGVIVLQRGAEFSARIEVLNRPTSINVTSIITGVRFRGVKQNEKTFVDIYGTIPRTANFSVSESVFTIDVGNTGGTDTFDAPFRIEGEAAAVAPDTIEDLYIERGDTTLRMVWSPGDDGGDPIIRYEVRIRQTGHADWGEWINSGSQNLTHTFTGLVNGRSYDVQGRAVNSIGAGSESVVVSGTPAGLPDAPTITESSGRDGQITLSWTAGDLDGGDIANWQYRIKKGTADYGIWTTIDGDVHGISIQGETNFIIPGVENGSVYAIQVRAVTNVGESPPSNEVIVTVLDSTAPSNVAPVFSATPAIAQNEGTSISYNLAGSFTGATSYSFQGGYSKPSWLILSGGVLSGTLPQVSADTTLDILVRGTNAFGTTNGTIQVRIVNIVPPPVFSAPAAQSAREGSIWTLDLTSVFTGARSYRFKTGYSAPPGLLIEGNRMRFSTVSEVQADTTINIEVTAVGDGGTTDATIRLLIRNSAPTRPPTFIQPSPQSGNEGEEFHFNLILDFLDATSYSFQPGYSPPSWLSLSGSILSGTLPQVTTDQTIEIRVRGSNDLGNADGTIQLTIRNVVQPPAFSAPSTQSGNERSSWSFDLSTVFTRAASYSFRQGYSKPSWLSLSGSTLSGTLPNVGSDTTINILVSGTNTAGTTNGSITLRIVNIPPPVFTAPSIQSRNEGTSWSFDLDGVFTGETSYSFQQGYSRPSWLSLSGGVLSGTLPSVSSTQTINILVRGTNGSGSTNGTIQLRIVNVPVLPVFTATSVQSGNEGSTWSFSLSSVFSGATSYSFQGGYVKPSWLSLSGGTLSGRLPSVNSNQTLNILVRGTNSDGGTDGTIRLTIINVSQTPVFTAPVTQRGNERTSWSFNLTTVFSGAFAYGFQGGYSRPSWLRLSGTTLSGTLPSVSSDTTINIQVQGINSDGSTNGTITLVIVNVPMLPIFTAPTTQSVNEGTSWSFDLSSVFSGAVTYNFQRGYSRPSWLSLSVFGVLSGTLPSVSSTQTINILVRGTNSDGTTNGTIQLRIVDLSPPVFLNPSIDQQTEGRFWEFDMSNAFRGATSYSFQSGYSPPSWLNLSGGALSGTLPEISSNQTYIIRVRGTNIGGSAEGTLTLNVRNVPQNRVPTFFGPVSTSGEEGASWTWDLILDYSYATSWSFQSGYTPPSWLSLNGFRLSGTLPQVDRDTTFNILTTGTNDLGSVNGTIVLIVSNN